ncbi:BspA family leucine-rich repeat surface protein [Lactobacillus laiwuensis]|uniref:BspA family leucine-rich repeat surface protein n=1 Tax=Lactobacillus laiwuensis TaxID=2841034 RepID=UPI001CC70E21|nr:BspA family leucine-rich repeat surface protein [Lactobacillus laiwuensis]
MNTHKNANKQGEKILLGGVAAAALGLINAKPQTVKAANQNGTRATKKTVRRTVKTKLTYQTEAEGAAVSDDESTDQNSSSQTAGSENNAGTSSSAPETEHEQTSANSSTASENSADAAAGNTSDPSTTDKAKADKQEADHAQFDPAKATRDGAISSRWNDIPVTADNGVLKIGSSDKQYTIKNDNLLKNIGIKNNIPWVDTSKITEINILGTIEIEGYANNLFSGLSSLQTFKGLENLKTDNITRMDDMFDGCSSLTSLSFPKSFNTSKVTNMQDMFENCTALETLDLSNFDTSNVREMLNMFNGCTNLKSLNLQNFNTDKIDDFLGLGSMFENCTNLEELNIENFNIPSAKSATSMFDNDPNLRKLVLGPKCNISSSYLNVQGTWVNMGLGKGSPKKGTCKWYYPQAFLDEFNPSTQHDAYVCFADLGGPITVHYQSDNKDIADADEQFGDIDTKLVNDDSFIAFKPKEIKGYKFDHAEFNGSTTDIDSFLFTSKPQTVNLIYTKNGSSTPNGSEGSTGSDGSNGSNSSDSSNGSNGSNSSNTSNSSNGSDSSNDSNSSNSSNSSDSSDGSNGSNSSDSSNGSTGSDSSDGSIGSDSSNSSDSSDGSNGSNSSDSSNGSTGSDSSDGSTGSDSSNSSNSSDSSDGSDSSNGSNSSNSSNSSNGSNSSNTSNSSDSSDSSNGSNSSNSSNSSNGSNSSNTSNSSDSSNGSNSSNSSDSSNGSNSSNSSNSSDSSNGSNSSNSSNSSNGSNSSNSSNSSDSSNGSNSSNGSESNGSNASNTAGSIVNRPAAIAPAVTVHYQDEYGNSIAPDRVIQGRIGDGYTTGAETVSGYTLKTRPDNATGFFINSPQSVTYVYSKNDGQTNNSTPAPAGNQTPTDNEPTPIPSSKKAKKKNAPKKASKGLHANKQSKKAPAKSIKGLTANKHQANRPAKLAAADHKLNKKGKLDQDSRTDALPQTGTEKHNSLAMLALGGLALATALGAAWLERKKD